MPRIRYSRWDHTVGESPGADSVFDQLNDHMNDTGDLQQAMRRLMRRGLKQEDKPVHGLDELLAQLTREMKKIYDRYKIQSVLDEAKEAIQQIVQRERETLRDLRETRPETAEKEAFLDRLPTKWNQAMEKLASYDFENDEAGAAFQELLQQMNRLLKLEQAVRREGNLFQGHEPVNLDGAEKLLERLEGLRHLEGQLSSARLKDVDLELLRQLLGEESRQEMEGVMQMQSALEEAGYLLDRGDRFEFTPKGIRRVGQLALRDIYKQLWREGMGRHPLLRRGSHEPIKEQSRPYEQGDLMDLDMIQTLKNSMLREARSPLSLAPEDFVVHDSDRTTQAATVLLLDMSWSMSWEGRFAAAKKVALAMDTLVRSQYARDYFAIVGFFTRAVELKARDLPEVTWNMGDPFTNLQEGLHLATGLLERKRSRNQQMIVITDGQPTAYCRQGRLYCEWPLSFGGICQRAAEETLREAERVTRKGITINTFMLDDSPVLKGFIDKMTRINKGRAFYTTPDRLGEYLLVDYVAHRRKKI